MEEAKEIINDGFLKVFKKIAQYKQETSFEGWLRKIMVNTAIDHYRKESKHYDYYSTDKKTIEYGQTNIIDEMSHKELISLIQGLTPGYRAVFNLYVIDGYKHEEIAVLLHISVGTSKSNLSKAREILRTALEKMNTKTLVKYV
ncbi:MAG: RNA polymerase ECF-type sigma factor [Cytophagales bacterium]|nr:MAG: RNA polymerase ECF-type sigma factor [Cytophagales bacterium]